VKKTYQIKVSDNGPGVTSENLKSLFQHGFTTKKTGHGFGLHSAANDAKQMGGQLWCESEGLGKGATFIFELPFE
jgi:signal transduction histidine kinase